MHRFKVANMTCGHCASRIGKAVESIDPQADVSVDLSRKEIAVRSEAEEARIVEAIRLAGYEIQKIAA